MERPVGKGVHLFAASWKRAIAVEGAKLATGRPPLARQSGFRPKRPHLAGVVVLVAVAALLSVLLSAPATQSRGAVAKTGQGNALGGLPPLFVKNRGQVDHRASYYLQGRDTGVFFTRKGLALSLLDSSHKHRFGLRLDFLGAGAGVTPVGQARTRAVTSYFKGGRADWKTNVPNYSRVAYRNLWPGIDLVYSGEGTRLKYNFLVKPGADPANIRLGWRGASGLAVDERGQLEVSTPARSLVDDAPTTYQRKGGRRIAVKSSYAVDAKRKTYGFSIAGYDRSQPLVIDPAVLVYAGYIGGSGFENGGHVALDAGRNLYVIGSTTSTDFPATVGPDTSFNGGATDVYVAKVNPSGTGLVYAGFIGGSQRDDPFKIAVDATGAAYVAGSTSSTPADGFPVTVGPDLTYNGGPQDAFVAKVKPDGTGLDYAGYIGGAGTTPPMAQGNEQANAVALDGTGHAYVSGFTRSGEASFPNGTGFGSVPGYDQTVNGALDAFVAKVKPDGSGLDYATYLGGGGADAGTGVSVDASGNAYQNVRTGSNQKPKDMTNPFGGFPVTAGAFDTTFNGGPNVPAPSDTAEVKLNPAGTALVYSTYIGGTGTDLAFSNVIDSVGNVYITGQTDSDESTFPNGQGFGTIPGFDHVLNAGPSSVTPTPADSFVVKLNASGSNLDYATYVGGSGTEQSVGIDLNSARSAYISGITNSGDGTFPAINGPDSTFNGDPVNTSDAFVAKLTPTGTALGYAGFIGGSNDEPDAVGMKVDSDGNAYISGSTMSREGSFPVTVGPDLTYNGGAQDAWVAKIAEVTPGPPPPGGGGGGGGSPPPSGAAPDRTAPGVSSYGVTNNPFVVSGAKTPTFGFAAARRHKKGTTFRYTLSEAGTVLIRIAQRAAGRRRGKRCVAPTRKLRRARNCTRLITRGTLTRVSRQGRNSVAFSGRIGSRKLSPGSYQATLTATDAAGNTSRGKTITFKVVKR